MWGFAHYSQGPKGVYGKSGFNALIAWHKEVAPSGETSVVFRDIAFADDVV